jgi:predicted branched-subunit amino acid permease
VGAATLAAVLVNARFLPMGLAVAPSLAGGRLRRAAEGQMVVDASWAMANRGDGTFGRKYLIGATVPQLGAWIVGTVVGAAAVIALLAPALLTALVLVDTVTSGRRLVVDARLAGVAAAGIALLLRAPVLLVLAVAVATTALLRLVGA